MKYLIALIAIFERIVGPLVCIIIERCNILYDPRSQSIVVSMERVKITFLNHFIIDFCHISSINMKGIC